MSAADPCRNWEQCVVVQPSIDLPDADYRAEPELESGRVEDAEVGLGYSCVEIEDDDNLLQSELLPSDILENYKSGAAKLKRELQSMDFSDHLWKLKTYDHQGVAVVKIFCGECNKESGGFSGDHSRYGVQNLFTNFKKSHLHSALHIKQWCKRRDIPYNDHPKKDGKSSKPVMYSPADHKRLVEEGLSILESVNDSISLTDPPFVVVGNINVSQFKSFWFKVRCKVDGELLYLCPQKGNLRGNLENHIHGLLHSKCCEDVAAANSSSNKKTALTFGKWGRPTTRSKSLTRNQRDLHSWFGSSDSPDSSTAVESPSGMHKDSILSLLCWGFRNRATKYAGRWYSVQSLLNDPKPGALWTAEPNTTTDFVYKGETVLVRGCFRHVNCKRLCSTGEPFTNFTCSNCKEIDQATNFRLRVLREGRALVKRGSRDTLCGRRVDYLSCLELAAQSRSLARKFRLERARHWLMKSRLAQFKVSHRGLKLSAVECFNRKDVLSFCNNILAAHRTNAFGGKPALWDFLRDVATNLNRVRQGHRFSKNTKSFAQAMRIYGGRRMCDLFALNFGGPSYDCTKRENKKGVQFIAGEHSVLFAAVAEIYREAKVTHGVEGPVPVILAEDETKVRSRITWDARSDGLVGFCGEKDSHVCKSSFKPTVGNGEDGYSCIVDSFRLNDKGSFARVIMVNPLHDKLPRLVLAVSCTCNRFNSDWVRNQWSSIDVLWQDICGTVVGPIVGHASDGDSRRRQLMLEDYRSKVGLRYQIPWEGWSLSCEWVGENKIKGLHDQDFIHNGKKLINPLDSAVKNLQLGADVCYLDHLGMVYQNFGIDEHGLCKEDVERTDRQNWASAQRICAKKARTCLHELRSGRDAHQERTLGTQLYLEICADYIDIFLSVSLTLRERIVLASKVSFFFRIWKLWFQHGDLGVGGNTKNLTLQECFVSNQCYLDVQLSCHFVVLLIRYFRDAFPHLPVPLHLTGSDSCEIFFSKVGGMQGMERAYDFQELVGCANTVNQLAAIEYGPNGLQFGRAHNKQQNIWADLHPLERGQSPADLGDYSELAKEEDLVVALKEGLKAAQAQLKSLNMAPSSYAWKKQWFLQPWVVEKLDPKHWTFVATEKTVPGEDGDAEVMRDCLIQQGDGDTVEGDTANVDIEFSAADGLGPNIAADSTAVEEPADDAEHDLRLAEEECRDAISQMLDSAEVSPAVLPNLHERGQIIQPVVEYMGKAIYKSTLVAELNGNPFLSKDRLTRIKNSIYFNNAEDYLSAARSGTTGLLGLGSDCGVLFMQSATLGYSSGVKAARKRNRTVGQVGRPALVTAGVDIGTWWLGRVQKMCRRVEKTWGLCRNPIDTDARKAAGRQVSSSSSIEVMLNWFKSAPGRNKFKYEVTDTQWIDIDSIICVIALSYNPINNVYSLLDNDRQILDDFVSTKP